MTKEEKFAYKHVLGTAKVSHGRTGTKVQQEAIAKWRSHAEGFLSSDRRVLELAQDGLGLFVEQAADKLLKEQEDRIFLKRCPRCGKLARTPKERQCRHCRYDWH